MLEPQNSEKPQVTNVSQTDVQSVHADVVRMHQASAETINANEIELEQSAAVHLQAGNVNTHQSALVAVEAQELLAQNTAIVFAEAQKAAMRGYLGAVSAQNAEIQYSLAGIVVGNDVHVENARTILLVGRNINGNVTTLMDSRSALIAGLVGALFSGLMLLLGRMLFGRK
jgi:hypothetical protein